MHASKRQKFEMNQLNHAPQRLGRQRTQKHSEEKTTQQALRADATPETMEEESALKMETAILRAGLQTLMPVVGDDTLEYLRQQGMHIPRISGVRANVGLTEIPNAVNTKEHANEMDPGELSRNLAARHSEIDDLRKNLNSQNGRLIESQIIFEQNQRDLVDSRQREADLKRSNEELESLVAELSCARDFAMEKDTYEKQDKMIATLEKRLNGTRSELAQCKDDLFRLQPLIQVPISAILKDFETICGMVVNWIEGEEQIADEGVNGVTNDIFVTDHRTLFGRFMKERPATPRFLLRYLVNKALMDHVFSESEYLFGLPARLSKWLQSAELAMENLEPPRDQVTRANWRAETLNAISQTEDYKIARHQLIPSLAEQIFEDLELVFPALSGNEGAHDRFLADVVTPASELALRLQTIPVRPTIDMDRKPLQEWGRVGHHHHARNTFIDMESSGKLKDNDSVVESEAGGFGTVLIPLEPALERLNQHGQSVILRNPCWLVQLDHPLKTRQQAR